MSISHGHYVPQGYLKLFSADGKYIECYNKETKIISSPNIRNVCSINELYSISPEALKNGGGNSNDIENGFFLIHLNHIFINW